MTRWAPCQVANNLYCVFIILLKLEVGLKGCGWKTARLLAQSGLAKSLFLAASTSSSRAGLQDFFVSGAQNSGLF